MTERKVIQKIVLAAIVFGGNRILILQRHKNELVYPNMWELPSGKREAMEPSEKALIREVKEETGLLVKPIMPISVFDYQIEKPDEIRDSTQINFLVEKEPAEEVHLSSEHQNFAWILEGEIDKYNLTDATKGVIKQAFKIVKLLKIGM